MQRMPRSQPFLRSRRRWNRVPCPTEDRSGTALSRARRVSGGDDAFAAHGCGYGDGRDGGEGSVGVDAGGVDDARGGAGVAERAQGAVAVVVVAGQAGAAGVGGVEPGAGTGDPAGRGLPGGGLRDRGQGAVAVDGEGGYRVGAGFGQDQVAAGVEGDRERYGAGQYGHDRRGRQAVEVDGEDVDVVAVGLGGHDELRPVRGEGDLPGGVGELGRQGRVQAQAAVPGRDPNQGAVEAQVALDGAAAAGVEYVDEVAMHGDADREVATGGDHLAAVEVVAVDGECGDRVAARVDRVQAATVWV